LIGLGKAAWVITYVIRELMNKYTAGRAYESRHSAGALEKVGVVDLEVGEDSGEDAGDLGAVDDPEAAEDAGAAGLEGAGAAGPEDAGDPEAAVGVDEALEALEALDAPGEVEGAGAAGPEAEEDAGGA
jgi:hypothetical protein